MVLIKNYIFNTYQLKSNNFLIFFFRSNTINLEKNRKNYIYKSISLILQNICNIPPTFVIFL